MQQTWLRAKSDEMGSFAFDIIAQPCPSVSPLSCASGGTGGCFSLISKKTSSSRIFMFSLAFDHRYFVLSSEMAHNALLAFLSTFSLFCLPSCTPTGRCSPEDGKGNRHRNRPRALLVQGPQSCSAAAAGRKNRAKDIGEICCSIAISSAPPRNNKSCAFKMWPSP